MITRTGRAINRIIRHRKFLPAAITAAMCTGVAIVAPTAWLALRAVFTFLIAIPGYIL